jgi:hypothetical protein
VIWLGELRYGVERMVAKARPSRLGQRLQDELPVGWRAAFYVSLATTPRLGEKQYRVARLRDVPSARQMPSLQETLKITASRWSRECFRLPTPQGHSHSFDRRRDQGLVLGQVPAHPPGGDRELKSVGKRQRQDTRQEAYTRPAAVRRLAGVLKLGWETGIEPATVGATVRCSAS